MNWLNCYRLNYLMKNYQTLTLSCLKS